MRTLNLSRGLYLAAATAALLAAFFAASVARAADDRPLPRYFDQLNLTDDQVQQVRAVQDQYDGKIAAEQAVLEKARGRVPSYSAIIVLVKVIKKLEAKRNDALLSILDDGQRQKLQELLDAGKS
jgi:hypothetical protein